MMIATWRGTARVSGTSRVELLNTYWALSKCMTMRDSTWRRPREGGDPVSFDETRWIPAFAGMTEYLSLNWVILNDWRSMSGHPVGRSDRHQVGFLRMHDLVDVGDEAVGEFLQVDKRVAL